MVLHPDLEKATADKDTARVLGARLEATAKRSERSFSPFLLPRKHMALIVLALFPLGASAELMNIKKGFHQPSIGLPVRSLRGAKKAAGKHGSKDYNSKGGTETEEPIIVGGATPPPGADTCECNDENEFTIDSCNAGGDCINECKPLPVSCARAEPYTVEHKIVEAERCSFALSATPETEVSKRRQLINALLPLSDGKYTVEDILSSHLNRQSNPGISDINAEQFKLEKHEFKGFRFDDGDENVEYWMPQGITGTWDAFAKNDMPQDAMLVSWYHKTEAITPPPSTSKGVRVSLMDTHDPANVTYRHMLLVEPIGTASDPDFLPVWVDGTTDALHAGGIVWWGDLLYVADTHGGLRVFDMASIMRVKDTDNKDAIGVSSGFSAHGYKFIVPELRRYRLVDDSCTLRFSCVALDRSSDPPALVTGEYRKDNDYTHRGRILVWDLDPATGLIDVSRPSAAYVGGQTRVQGAVRYNGNIYISSSSQVGDKLGRLYRTRLGHTKSFISAWVKGAEDLYITRNDDVIWTVAEWPGTRDVVGIPIRLPDNHKIFDAPRCFGLAPTPEAEIVENRKLIEALVALSEGRVALSDLLNDLNREGQKGFSPEIEDHFRNLDFKGFRWNEDDVDHVQWYPQGITGTWDATQDGRFLGEHEAMIISSYDKSDPYMGARISLFDTTNLEEVKYRHILLVKPSGTEDKPTFSVEMENGKSFHAGGIVWLGNYLYVADDQNREDGYNGMGWRVFDLSSIMLVPGRSKTDIGVSGDSFDAFGYKYIVPEVMRYELLSPLYKSCPFRFNCVALDRSSDPMAFVTAEYTKDLTEAYGRVAVWDITPSGDGLLNVPSGQMWPSAAYVSGETRMQGAVRYNGNIYMSSSAQHNSYQNITVNGETSPKSYGELSYNHIGSDEPNNMHVWALGAEDLYVDRGRDMIWTAGEWPGFREVVGVRIP